MKAVGIALTLALLATGLPEAGEGTLDDPLRDEDVVRLWVSGRNADTLVELIRRSHVEFDLEEDMLVELELAGLPRSVIDAMVERQRETDLARARSERREEAPPPAEARRPALVVPIDAGGGERTLRLIDEIDTDVAESLQLSVDGEPRFTDLAVFLICRTPDHVPDHWRGKSPLGRDFASAPRHRMLSFVAGAEVRQRGAVRKFAEKMALAPGARDSARTTAVLELPLPASFEVPLDDASAHDLSVGVAAEVSGERFYVIARGDLDGVEVEEDGPEIRATVRNKGGSGPRDLVAELVRTPSR